MKFAIDLIETLAPLLTLGFGIYGAVNDTKPKDGKITKQGKIAIWGIIISGFVTFTIKASNLYYKVQDQERQIIEKITQDSIKKVKDSIQLAFQNEVANKLTKSVVDLENIKTDSRDIVDNLNVSLEYQNQILTEQLESQKQVLKAYYPLEPFTIFYEKEYPMDQKYFKEFTQNVEKEFIKYAKLRGQDNFGVEDLKNDLPIFLFSNPSIWLAPDAFVSPIENILITDDIAFEFVKEDLEVNNVIQFSSIPYSSSNVFLKLQSKGELKQTIQVFADFSRRMFIQKVRCDNPIRSNNDLLSISSIDLINRKLKWKNMNISSLNWNLKKIAFKFQYDYEDLNSIRFIEIPKGENEILISSKNLGLESIFTRLN